MNKIIKYIIMKKLFISAAIILGSVSGFATASPDLHVPKITVTVQDDFTEIKTEEVPDAVRTAIKTAYPDATLDKAYVNTLKEYKLEITVRDQKATVYADANGNWIKK